jgi:hypothetical protein
MRYIKPLIQSTYKAISTIQGSEVGNKQQNLSDSMNTATIAAYQADE